MTHRHPSPHVVIHYFTHLKRWAATAGGSTFCAGPPSPNQRANTPKTCRCWAATAATAGSTLRSTCMTYWASSATSWAMQVPGAMGSKRGRGQLHCPACIAMLCSCCVEVVEFGRSRHLCGHPPTLKHPSMHCRHPPCPQPPAAHTLTARNTLRTFHADGALAHYQKLLDCAHRPAAAQQHYVATFLEAAQRLAAQQVSRECGH